MKTTMIYTLPKQFIEDTLPTTDCGCIAMDKLTTEDIFGSFERYRKFYEWVVENVWEGDDENYDAIGMRLAFLLNLRDEDFEKYRPMADEKEFIYSLQNEYPEISTAYNTYSKILNNEV
jgi:hypothetical protein